MLALRTVCGSRTAAADRTNSNSQICKGDLRPFTTVCIAVTSRQVSSAPAAGEKYLQVGGFRTELVPSCIYRPYDSAQREALRGISLLTFSSMLEGWSQSGLAVRSHSQRANAKLVLALCPVPTGSSSAYINNANIRLSGCASATNQRAINCSRVAWILNATSTLVRILMDLAIQVPDSGKLRYLASRTDRRPTDTANPGPQAFDRYGTMQSRHGHILPLLRSQ